MTDEVDALIERKAMLRRQAYDARNAQADKDQVSDIILDKFLSLPEYLAAATVMWYIDARSEVRTRRRLAEALTGEKRIVVPYCTQDEHGANKLGLWNLVSMDELVVGKWKILEPPRERWGESGKEASPADLDLVMVPGVAFSQDGARMGNGQGYYDRLMGQVRPDSALVALAYECQMLAGLPVAPHDVYMDRIVTERAVYPGLGRKGR
jgi:5-formyltetrahydrofolate cyclo-ligase